MRVSNRQRLTQQTSLPLQSVILRREPRLRGEPRRMACLSRRRILRGAHEECAHLRM